MRLLALVCIWLLSLCAVAQGQEIPKAAVDALAKDLAQLHEAVLEAQRKQQAQELAASKFPWVSVNKVAVTHQSASVRAGANDKAALLLTAKKNQTFPVVDKAGDWYAVALPEKTQGISAGWIPAADVVPMLHTVQATSGTQSTSSAGGIFNDLTERAVRFRETYEKNPYFSVTGFAVNVGVSPSVSINFEFKKK